MEKVAGPSTGQRGRGEKFEKREKIAANRLQSLRENRSPDCAKRSARNNSVRGIYRVILQLEPPKAMPPTRPRRAEFRGLRRSRPGGP